MPSAPASHRRVEPSTSVNRNVTTPEGGPPADTRTGCHTKPTTIQQTATDFRNSRMSSVSRQRMSSLSRQQNNFECGIHDSTSRLPGLHVQPTAFYENL